MNRTYRAHKSKSKRKTYRSKPVRGGTIEAVEKIIQDTPVESAINIINEKSNFVVATYWWGKGNMNRNLQFPCPEDIMDKARAEVLKQIRGFPADIVRTAKRLNEIMERRSLTQGETILLESTRAVWKEWKDSIMNREDTKRLIKEAYDKIQAQEQATNPNARPVRSFPEMIQEWEDTCRKANVNFVALNTEFERADYQNGINGKPLFIKKILDQLKKMNPDNPKGVLYIDGDMWVKKYPHIFDIDGVDFMARGWNTDPRAKEAALSKPYYDPYTFETSGGTMYFGNTQTARDLLDKWSVESSKPEAKGKADDRILSQVFTTQSFVVGTNIINLPIEYLWLTDLYKSYLTGPDKPSSIEDALIEHPYCLTGEERAADQGAAASREPEGYEEEVIDNINYKRQPELFYEYIFFNQNQNMRDGFGRYLKYMKDAKNGFTGQPMMNIVDFSQQYGDYNEIAKKNAEGLTLATGGQSVSLPQTATVREILTALYAGSDVEIGAPIAEKGPEDEFVGTDASTKSDGLDMYTRAVRVDTQSPMFLSGKSAMIRHLLLMCETLEDINKHVGSYMFLSRIRWNLLKPAGKPETEVEEQLVSSIVPPIKQGVDFKPIVNQIWFGDDMPEWRKKMFEFNKSVCEAHGFKHKLWKNEDRTQENFEQTLAYQNAAIKAGEETGQSRWAQVVDLARLEIVYNTSGIYIDALFEISPAFLKGVVDAVNAGAEFVGCNEDACDPPLDCKNAQGEMYLTNSFFAATRANPIFKRLLSPESLDSIDMSRADINKTTGPYFLRSGITSEDKVFLFDSDQIYMFNQQETPYKPAQPNRFVTTEQVPGSIKVRQGLYYKPGGLEVLQQEFVVEKKGPIAIYHSGLGGTWST